MKKKRKKEKKKRNKRGLEIRKGRKKRKRKKNKRRLVHLLISKISPTYIIREVIRTSKVLRKVANTLPPINFKQLVKNNRKKSCNRGKGKFCRQRCQSHLPERRANPNQGCNGFLLYSSRFFQCRGTAQPARGQDCTVCSRLCGLNTGRTSSYNS